MGHYEFFEHGFSRKTLGDNGDIKQFSKDARGCHVVLRQHWRILGNIGKMLSTF